MGPNAGVDIDNNLTLCPLQSRLQHAYPGQPYARVGLAISDKKIIPRKTELTEQLRVYSAEFFRNNIPLPTYARVNLNPVPELTLYPQSETLDLASDFP